VSVLVDLSVATPILEAALGRLQQDLPDFGFVVIAIRAPSLEETASSAESVVLAGLIRSTVPPELADAAMKAFSEQMTGPSPRPPAQG
jgi:hypothetical protein